MLEKIVQTEKKIARDGTGKRIRIKSDFLGATLQLPQLICAIQELMPNITIDLACSDFHSEDTSLQFKEHFSKYKKSNSEDIFNRINMRQEIGKYDLYLAPNSHDINGKCIAQQNNAISFHVDSLKYERRPLLTQEEQHILKASYKLKKRKVIVAGSMNVAEIEPLYEAFRYVRKQHRNTALILVPRSWPEQTTNKLDQLKIKYILDQDIENAQKVPNIIISTKQGHLPDLYSICDAAVIGHTFTRGCGFGQNPLEPAFYGKKIVSGNYWVNNKEAFDGLKKAGLLTTTNSQEELNSALANAITTPQNPKHISKAESFIHSKSGAAREYALFIQDSLYSLPIQCNH